MRAHATVTVDLHKIEENACKVVGMLPGVSVVGVTKVTCGTPEVARSMLAGGCRGIAESRLENVSRLREGGIDEDLWLLRGTVPDLAEEVVSLTDVSLESEVVSVEALDRAAARLGKRHSVVAMVDLGDLREGMMPEDLAAFVDHVEGLPHVDLLGVGTSLTCYGAIVPTAQNLGELVGLAEAAEDRLGRKLLVSGGMSSSIDAALAGHLPARVDNLRIGESILLGVSTVTRQPLPGLHTDAFTVAAPVIECKVKPSMPRGTCAQDAFGNVPDFTDWGERRRAILALGRQDAPPAGLTPLDPRVQVLGASSDHLIVDVEELPEPPRVGDELVFVPNYAATLQLFTSGYVRKAFV